MEQEQKTKIILRRKAEWLNRLRGYKVFIDGAEKASVKNGASEEILTEPGIHKVQCKIDWCLSREFEVQAKPGETLYLLVKNGLKYFWICYGLLIIGLVYNLFYTFSHTPKPAYFAKVVWILILPAVIYMLYYLTIGRKDYLVVSKDTNNIFAQ